MLNYLSITALCFSLQMLIAERTGLIKDSYATMCQALGLIAFITLIIDVYKKNNSFILTHVYQIIYFFGMLLSSFLLSLGMPMIEIGEIGTANGVFWLLIIYFIIGLYSTNFGFKCGQKTTHLQDNAKFNIKIEKTMIILMLIITLGFSLLIVIRYGVPEGSAERTIFWDQVVPQNLAWVNSAIKQFFFFIALAVIFPLYKSNKLSNLMLIAAILLTIYVLGEKASAFIILFSTYMFIYSAKKYLEVNLKLILSVLVMLGFILYMIINSYRQSGYGDAFVITRIALQAQVLWATLNAEIFPFYPVEELTNIPNILAAADYMTFKFVPYELYEIYNETGSTLSGFFPAFQLIYFGLWGSLVVQMVISIIIGFVAGMTMTAIRVRSYILSYLLFKIYLALVFSSFALIFSAVFSLVFVLSVILVVMMYILSNIGGQHRVMSGDGGNK